MSTATHHAVELRFSEDAAARRELDEAKGWGDRWSASVDDPKK